MESFIEQKIEGSIQAILKGGDLSQTNRLEEPQGSSNNFISAITVTSQLTSNVLWEKMKTKVAYECCRLTQII